MNRQVMEEWSDGSLLMARSSDSKGFLREGIGNDVVHEPLKERKKFRLEGSRLE